MSDKYSQMIRAIMNLCVLSSNWMMKKKHVTDPSPRLFNVEPNEDPPILILHMNTFARNGK